MKKFIATALAATLCLSCLSSCSNNKSSAEDVLYVFNWSEYIPQSVYDSFEEETGIHVVETTYSSNEEMLAKLVAGGSAQYDVAIASSYVLNAMKEQNLIQEINTENIPNMSNLSSAFLGRSFDPNNEWSIPYMSTITLIAVNTKMCEELGVEINSLDDLTNPALKNNIVAVDDCREIVDIALKVAGEDPDTTDPDVISSVIPWMKELGANIKLYDSDTAYSALATNEVAVGIVYNMDAALAIEENDDISIVTTTEPSEMSIDNFVITKDSKNVENAEKFINYILSPEVYAECLEEFPCVCLNDAALELMDDDFINNPAANVSSEELERAHIIEDVGDAATYYDDAFTQMKN